MLAAFEINVLISNFFWKAKKVTQHYITLHNTALNVNFCALCAASAFSGSDRWDIFAPMHPYPAHYCCSNCKKEVCYNSILQALELALGASEVCSFPSIFPLSYLWVCIFCICSLHLASSIGHISGHIAKPETKGNVGIAHHIFSYMWRVALHHQ